MSPQEFAQKIRAKYPGSYDEMDDVELTNRVIEKYPVYKSQVKFEEPEEIVEQEPSLIEETTESLETRADRVGGILARKDTGIITKGVQTFGQGAGLASDVIEGAVERIPGVKKAFDILGKGISWLSETKPVQALANKIGEQEAVQEIVNLYDTDTDFKDSVDAVSNIVRLGGDIQLASDAIGISKKIVEKAPTVAKTVIETSPKLPKMAVQQGKETLLNLATKYYSKEERDVIKSLETSYKKIPLSKTLMKGEAETGKSFAQFMSEKPQYSVPVENMKFNTWETAQKLRKEVSLEARALEELLKDTPGQVTFKEFTQRVRQRISNSFSGLERESALNYVDRELEALVRQHGSEILTLSQANKLKQVFWERSPLGPSPTRADKLASSADYKMGQSMRELLEDKIPDADLQALNSEVGDYYHSINVLENIHGGAAPRGRLGQGFAQIGGVGIGAVSGGLVGSLIGYFAAPKIVEIFSNPAMTTSIKRYVVSQLIKERPSVAQQVFDLMKKRGMEREATFLLEESKSIPLGPKTPSESVIKLVPAEKGPVGVNPKTGRFMKTYKSQ